MQRNKSSQGAVVPKDIVLDDDKVNDSLPHTTLKKYPKHKKKHKNTRNVTVNCTENMETLVVTQKVKVKKQKYGCIIKLANICEHRSNDTIKINNKSNISMKSPMLNSERIVPKCFRDCYKLKRNRNCKKCKTQKNSKHAKKGSSGPKQKPELSSIPSSSLNKHTDLVYEDVSSDSFTTFPSEDDIDILIERTKNREISAKPFHSYYLRKMSTSPYLESISDGETIVSHSDSTATLVLATQPEMYSPTRPTISPDNNNIDKERNPAVGRIWVDMMKERNEDNNFSKSCQDVMIFEKDFVKTHQEKYYSPALSFDDKVAIENSNGGVSSYTSKSSIDHTNVLQHSCNKNHEPYSPSGSPICCAEQTWPYEVQIKCEPTDIVKTETKPIEANRIFKVEKGLSPTEFNSTLRDIHQKANSLCEYVDIKSEFQPTIKIEKDIS